MAVPEIKNKDIENVLKIANEDIEVFNRNLSDLLKKENPRILKLMRHFYKIQTPIIPLGYSALKMANDGSMPQITKETMKAVRGKYFYLFRDARGRFNGEINSAYSRISRSRPTYHELAEIARSNADNERDEDQTKQEAVLLYELFERQFAKNLGRK